MRYDNFMRYLMKNAAAVMTPEAMQAAQQPPMDPSMGGMPPQGGQPPMDQSMMGGMPQMDPAMQGGMPPQGGQPPMDPSMGGMPPQGGQLPPEIMQDQMFMQFLAEMVGIMLDPNSGTFVDQQGQPVPPEAIMQLYQQFQQQMMSMQGGMPPQGGQPPMDPSMMGGMPPQGGDPSMQSGQPPMDPSMMGGMPPMDQAGGGAGAPPVPDEIMNQISSAVMAGVESVLQDFSASMEKKLAELNDKIDALSNNLGALVDTDDQRTVEDVDAVAQLRSELAGELNPIKQASVTVVRAVPGLTPLNIFDLING